MTLMRWGRALLLWGLAVAVATFAPFLLLTMAPPVLSAGFLGTLAFMLSLTVAPLAAVVASVGAILLLVAVVRRDRF